MTVTSLLAVVAPRTGKIIKNGLCFWKSRRFATECILLLCIYVKPIV